MKKSLIERLNLPILSMHFSQHISVSARDCCWNWARCTSLSRIRLISGSSCCWLLMFFLLREGMNNRWKNQSRWSFEICINFLQMTRSWICDAKSTVRGRERRRRLHRAFGTLIKKMRNFTVNLVEVLFCLEHEHDSEVKMSKIIDDRRQMSSI